MAGGHTFQLDEVDGLFEVEPPGLRTSATVRLDGAPLPTNARGGWTVTARDGSPFHFGVRRRTFDGRVLVLCSSGQPEREVHPGIPKWLAVIVAVPALIALPNLCLVSTNPLACCGMVLPLSIYALNRSVAFRLAWSQSLRALIVLVVTGAYVGCQVALGLWVADIGAHRAELSAQDRARPSVEVRDGREVLVSPALGIELDAPAGLEPIDLPPAQSSPSANALVWRWRSAHGDRVLTVSAACIGGTAYASHDRELLGVVDTRIRLREAAGARLTARAAPSPREVVLRFIESNGAISYGRSVAYDHDTRAFVLTVAASWSSGETLEPVVDSLRTSR